MLIFRLVAYLPVRTKEDYVVFYTRLIDTNIDHFDMLGQIRILDMIVWMWYMYIGTNPGQVMVIDMEGATLGHIMKLNLVHLRKHVHYVQVCFRFVKDFMLFITTISL